MQISSLSFRSIIAAGLLAAGASAHADLTIPTNALVADSVQAFSEEAVDAFAAASVTVTPLGTATAVTGAESAFRLPITTITISSSLKIVKGDAKGAALDFVRLYRGKTLGLTLSNFTINYVTKQVLADVTPKGGATSVQQAIYTFNTQTPLGIKYQFPLKITGHEVLDTLKLTEVTKDSYMSALSLPTAIRAVLDMVDFGTLTQDIAVKFRAKPVSPKPYVPAP